MDAPRTEAPAARTGDPAELVSVVVTFLNAEPFLEEAIESVCAQSHPAWELLLVDDGSTDGSAEIAMRHAARDPGRVRCLAHPGHQNRGVSASRNLGIAAARGALVAFLDADDVWLPERLSRSVELFRAHPEADMVYGTSEYWRSWAVPEAVHPDRVQPHGFRADRLVRAPELLLRFLTHGATLPCPASMTVRRQAALECGFVEAFRGMHEDQAFLARFCLRRDVFVSEECWVRYRLHEGSLCAEAERRGEVEEAQRRYLAWLQRFLDEAGMRGTPVWEAARYLEKFGRIRGHGRLAKLRRLALRATTRARLAARQGGFA
jgi:glycosyltransferase involved in cell wall biosynthesis